MKCLITLFCILPFTSFAQKETISLSKKGIDTEEYVPKGIGIGEKAPEILLTSVNGRLVNSLEILKEKQLVSYRVMSSKG